MFYRTIVYVINGQHQTITLESVIMASQRISVIGMGYVGLCTAVGFANKGIKIVAVDKDSKKVDSINNGAAPFYEPELERIYCRRQPKLVT